MPKAWRRSASAFGGGSLPVIPPATILVVSVVSNGDGTATWTFTAAIGPSAVTQALSISLADPVTDQGAFGSVSLVVSYSADPAPGDTWSVDASLLGPCFPGGNSLVPGQSGAVA